MCFISMGFFIIFLLLATVVTYVAFQICILFTFTYFDLSSSVISIYCFFSGLLLDSASLMLQSSVCSLTKTGSSMISIFCFKFIDLSFKFYHIETHCLDQSFQGFYFFLKLTIFCIICFFLVVVGTGTGTPTVILESKLLKCFWVSFHAAFNMFAAGKIFTFLVFYM